MTLSQLATSQSLPFLVDKIEFILPMLLGWLHSLWVDGRKPWDMEATGVFKSVGNWDEKINYLVHSCFLICIFQEL